MLYTYITSEKTRHLQMSISDIGSTGHEVSTATLGLPDKKFMYSIDFIHRMAYIYTSFDEYVGLSIARVLFRMPILVR